jgi:hypothetical protein
MHLEEKTVPLVGNRQDAKDAKRTKKGREDKVYKA